MTAHASDAALMDTHINAIVTDYAKSRPEAMSMWLALRELQHIAWLAGARHEQNALRHSPRSHRS